MKVNLRLRAAVLFGTFSAALLISGYYLYPVLMSLGFFLICLYVVLFFCHHIFNRGWIRNLLFMIIFCTGVYSYIKLSDACSQTAVVSVEKQVETASSENFELYEKAYKDFDADNVETGIWNVMPLIESMDHTDYMGVFCNPVKLRRFYVDMCKNAQYGE